MGNEVGRQIGAGESTDLSAIGRSAFIGAARGAVLGFVLDVMALVLGGVFAYEMIIGFTLTEAGTVVVIGSGAAGFVQGVEEGEREDASPISGTFPSTNKNRAGGASISTNPILSNPAYTFVPVTIIGPPAKQSRPPIWKNPDAGDRIPTPTPHPTPPRIPLYW